MKATKPAKVADEKAVQYRRLPQLHALLLDERLAPLLAAHAREPVLRAGRFALGDLRAAIAAGLSDAELHRRLHALPAAVAAELDRARQPSLRPVLNATGVILHTNLGRAPLSHHALRNIVRTARGYCNLELDLATGERSRRDDHIEGRLLQLLARAAGLEDFAATHGAMAVNNCAAATFLALNTFAAGGEVLVSRGELVEIGGGFRVPEILARSGAVLREVGTTNRTRVADYADAMTPATRLILRVHPSNFKMEGFTERPALADLTDLGRRRGVPVFEDQGTGCVVSLDDYGLREESSLPASLRAHPDLIAASGDKLFGGPQCGLLIGRGELIAAARKNPLARAFRIDKLNYAALEATLLDYLAGRTREVPTLRMLALTAEELRSRCQALAEALAAQPTLAVEVVPAESAIGGGATPGAVLPSYALALRHAAMPVDALAAALRKLDPPVLARIHDGRLLLDLRTIPPEADATLLRLLATPL